MIFDFEVEGEQLISRKILRMGERAVDARPAWRKIRDLFIDFEGDLFASDGASSGRPWKPLLEGTVEGKVKAGLDRRILRARRELEGSLTRKGGAGQVFEMGPTFMVFGSSLKQARFQQRGTKILPARRPLDFAEGQKRQAVKVLQRFVLTGEV